MSSCPGCEEEEGGWREGRGKSDGRNFILRTRQEEKSLWGQQDGGKVCLFFPSFLSSFGFCSSGESGLFSPPTVSALSVSRIEREKGKNEREKVDEGSGVGDSHSYRSSFRLAVDRGDDTGTEKGFSSLVSGCQKGLNGNGRRRKEEQD